MDPEEELSPAEREAHDVVHAVVHEARSGGFFDEDPPARIDALLMAAARAHAPAPRAGWLARLRTWLAPVVLHPALAGAAALVVVGGVAGVLYLRKGVSVVQPEVATPSNGAAPAGPGRPVGSAAAQPDHPAFQATVETTTMPVTPPSLPDLKVPTEERPADRVGPNVGLTPRSRPEPDKRPVGDVGGADVIGDTSTVTDPFADVDRAVGGQAGEGRDGLTNEPVRAKLGEREESGGGTTPGKGVQQADPQPPPRGDEGAILESPTVIQESMPRRGQADRAAKDRAQAEQLTRQARTAAKRKDCGAVKVMASRVKKVDAAYYKATFVTDPAIKGCL